MLTTILYFHERHYDFARQDARPDVWKIVASRFFTEANDVNPYKILHAHAFFTVHWKTCPNFEGTEDPALLNLVFRRANAYLGCTSVYDPPRESAYMS